MWKNIDSNIEKYQACKNMYKWTTREETKGAENVFKEIVTKFSKLGLKYYFIYQRSSVDLKQYKYKGTKPRLIIASGGNTAP